MMVHLYWWKSSTSNFKNFGDEVGPYILIKLFKAKVNWVVHPSMRRYKYFITHYLSAGSIISEAKMNSVVWGSGIMFENQEVKDANFIAVRGPYTKSRLESLGYSVPNILGDPALLLPLCYNPVCQNGFEIGVIPHYVDYERVNKAFRYSSQVKVINLKTDQIEEVIRQIKQCKLILSSSLHGLIVPNAYGITAIWVKFSDHLGGDGIKFKDYLATVGLGDQTYIDLRNSKLELNELTSIVKQNQDLWRPNMDDVKKCQDDLLQAAPWSKPFASQVFFNIKHKIRFIYKLVKTYF
ncbi:polysaccharide pyruvyl transferase family protein [Leeuwenhoekiella sp. NPDC079379]|uniref:polysaccharide pyruvyl transferase family protein n=1 Tax=Leeuwenhoekiella sp. NPDC079379 TaxID=3364122 RepID=UPI0037CC2F30